MVNRAKIKELMNESACSHSKDKKPGAGCDMPKPGLAAGGCAFDGAQISLFPYADAVHLVHGPQTCLGASWETRETLSSYEGRDHTVMGFTTGITTNDVIFGGDKRLEESIDYIMEHYRPEAIEALQEESDYEARGDALYMHHEDVEARLEWAFYRPSGSHPDQVSDKNVIVAIMAFNHSRLWALERFNLVNKEVINDDKLRVKIRNRSRMLFRAMVDNDFTELVAVLERYPVFMDLACDQVINGRIWNETFADPSAASRFLEIVGDAADEKLLEGVSRRLQPVKRFSVDEARAYLQLLGEQVQNLHLYVKEHYVSAFEQWMERTSLHPLQKIAWQKQINVLKETA